MPFNPAQFVFQPRPLQQFDFGSSFRDLADSRLKRQQLGETERNNRATLGENQAQRADVNSLNAANFAKDRVTNEYEAANKRYQQKALIAGKMREAGQSNDQATVEALGPSLLELGGTFRKLPGENGFPYYDIQIGDAPDRGPLDVQGARRDIYGGGGPQVGQPFGMRSNVGPGGPALAERNPLGPPRNPFETLPGASAAAAGQMPSAPPQAPPVTPQAPPAQAPTSAEADLASLNEASSAPEEGEEGPATPIDPQVAAAQNPMNPPAFSPYRISTADVAARNQAQNQPLQQALEEGAPANFRGRVEGFNRNVSKLGMSPERQAALVNPLFQELSAMYRGEVASTISADRLANQKERQQQIADQRKSDTYFKHREAAFKGSLALLGVAGIKEINSRQMASRELNAILPKAASNGQAAYQTVAKMHDLADKGVMTKDDYIEAAHGNINTIEKIRRVFSKEFFTPTGLDPDSWDEIAEVAAIGAQVLRAETAKAADRLYSTYKNSHDEAERAGIAKAMRGTFDAEYIPEDLTDLNQEPEEPDTYKPEPSAITPALAANNDLGVTRQLPETLDGRPPEVSPNGTQFTRGSHVPAKPPRKGTAVERAKALLRK